MKPNLDEFEKFIKTETDLELSDFQLELAKSLIENRNKAFSGGLRSGRTTVFNLVDRYYKEKYPNEYFSTTLA